MIRWQWYVLFSGGGTMPEFTTVSVTEAQLRTIPGRQGKFINEYADYIQQVSGEQAGRLRIGESENPLTIRRRLAVAAKAMNTPLIIKRSGNAVYFWREDTEEEQPRTKRRYTRRIRKGSPGSLIPPDTLITEPVEAGEQEGAAAETTAPDQAFSKSEYLPIDKSPGVVAPFEHDLPSRP
jgi:hypothetical protein